MELSAHLHATINIFRMFFDVPQLARWPSAGPAILTYGSPKSTPRHKSLPNQVRNLIKRQEKFRHAHFMSEKRGIGIAWHQQFATKHFHG